MRLLELFLNETTEEDRAIISLSVAVFAHLKQYANKKLERGETIDVGTVGQLFDTAINVLDPVRLQLWNHKDILAQYPVEPEKDDEGKPLEDKRNILGFWDPNAEMVVLNIDYLDSNALKNAITHELRHALDDYKSGFKASRSERYSTPKKAEHRKDYSKDPFATSRQKNQSYHAKPEEINARFSEVLHGLAFQIPRVLGREKPDQVRPKIMTAFNTLMSSRNIAHLFPEKERSRDYKRLVKRGVDFIEKELAYLQKK